MNRIALYMMVAVVVVGLLLFTCTFQVRFNENAILATFAKADPETSVITDPGLHFKWPYPIQSVQKYDTRVRLLETRLENVMTADRQLVVVEVFMNWRISDVHRYYSTFGGDEAGATQQIEDRLHAAIGVFGKFNFNELLARNAESSRIPDAEEALLAYLTASGGGDQGVAQYGIQPVAVGVCRFILGEKTSRAVFERMKQERQALAADARATGEAEAARIESSAITDAGKIRTFANQIAESIRARGENEAAQYLAVQAQNEDLAILLRRLDALRAMMQRNLTIVIPQTVGPFDLLSGPPKLPTRTQGNAAATSDPVSGQGGAD